MGERSPRRGVPLIERKPVSGGKPVPVGPMPPGVLPEDDSGPGMSGVRPGRDGGATSGRAGSARAGAAEATARHCWVLDPPEGAGRWPGLLLEWQRTSQGWWAYVVYSLDGESLVQRWLPGMHLQPAPDPTAATT